jgi:dihydrofolate reductase
MSNVILDMAMSVDGFASGPKHEDGGLHDWYFAPQGHDAAVIDELIHGIAAMIIGKRVFGEDPEGWDTPCKVPHFVITHTARQSVARDRGTANGEQFWPEEAPFRTPVFVLTHTVRSPWERPGGTTFYFVNDGIESALRQARAVVGNRDIRIGGGADVIQQYLNAGLMDEFTVSVSPVFFGAGRRLFDTMDRHKVGLEIIEAINSPLVTHLRYTVTRL